MATPGTTAPGPAQTDAAVVAYLRELDHPLKREIQAVRLILLGVGPDIREGIKWKAPSFRTHDYFATVHVRSRERLQLVLHTGAKAEGKKMKAAIDDPAGLLTWLADDRCLATLGAGAQIAAHRAPFEAIVRAWIRRL